MSIFRRMTLAAGLAAPLFALPALAQTQITVQHGLPPNSHTGLGASTFKDNFERLTNNRFRVVVQRNDNEREMIESVQIGTLDCTFTSTGPVGNFVPEVRVFDVPFLFRDAAHAGDQVAQLAQVLIVAAHDVFGHGSAPLSRSGR